jgi:hypothetical protein
MLGFADSNHELKIYHILMIDHDNTQHGQINLTQISIRTRQHADKLFHNIYTYSLKKSSSQKLNNIAPRTSRATCATKRVVKSHLSSLLLSTLLNKGDVVHKSFQEI